MKRKQFFSKHCLTTLLSALILLANVTVIRAQDSESLDSNLPDKAGALSYAKSTSLQDFMREFKKVYGNIYYSYQSSTLKSVKVWYNELDAKKQVNPDVVLDAVLTPAGLQFEKVKEVYVIKTKEYESPSEKNENLSTISLATTAVADFEVRGKVTDANGAVAGATVTEKGKSNAVVTDNEGNFSINVTNGNAVLVFTSVGFKTLEVAVSGKSLLNVTLESAAQELEGVVVTALGLTREKKSLGYSIGTVKGEDMTKVANENILTSMAGRVSGVTINQTGGVGSSISMIIRGATSLGNNQPLFVVDGVPLGTSAASVAQRGNNNRVDYGSGIADINPDDIESVSVLKGPSAAALYGSRAGNGVVLITTKAGKKGQGFGVSFNTTNVWEPPVRYLDFHYRFANGINPNLLEPNSAYWGGPELDAGNTAVQWNSPIDANGNRTPTELVSFKDNMKNFVNTGFTTNNNLSVGGTTDKASYRLSYSNMSNKGLVPGQDLYRNSIALAGSYNVAKNLKISTNINWVRSNSNSRPLTNSNNGNPLEAIYIAPHVDMSLFQDIWEPGLEGIRQKKYATNRDNPYYLALGIQNGFTRDRVFGNVKIDWEIGNGFSAFVRGAMNTSSEFRETKIPWDYLGGSLPQGAYYIQSIFGQEFNTDFLVNYKKKVSDFDFSVSAGGNYMQQNGNDQYTGGRDLAMPGLYRISNVARATLEYANGASRKNIYSVYGMASVGYKSQLYLDLAARNDWSSTLPAANRSYFYPSASLSWLANSTFNLPSSISLLKVRGGWARSGNDTDPYRLYPTLGAGNWGTLVSTGLPGTLFNPQLKPEIATSIEAGLDLNMFNNRLRFDLTYYTMDNENQIIGITTPASSGYSSKLVNAGLLRSRGWELGLGGSVIAKKNWTWDVHTNFTRNRVRLVELMDGMNFYTQWNDNGAGAYTFVGDEMGNLYSETYLQVTDPTSEYYKWPILDPGSRSWIRMPAGAGNPNNTKVGNYNPRFIMGMQSTLTWKRWSLGLSFDWRNGGEFMSFTYRYGESDWKSQRQIDNLIPGGSYSKQELVDLLSSDPEKYIIPQNGNFPRVGGYTQETGGFPVTDGGNTFYNGVFVPGVLETSPGVYEPVLGGDNTTYVRINSRYPWNFNQQITFDASFIKLREIILTYRIPNLFGITRNASFSVFGRNIMLWNAAKIGIDPERAFWLDQGAIGGAGFKQGIERQNVTPWTVPIGFKLNIDF